METATLTTKGIKAAANYLSYQNYEVLETSCEGAANIIAREGKTLVFISVIIKTDKLPQRESNREEMELAAAKYLCEHEEEFGNNEPVRFDEIALLVASASKALLRHHINALGE